MRERFNERRGRPVATLYGVLTSGTDWRFLQLEETQVTLDLREYPITELNRILGILVRMCSRADTATKLAAHVSP